MGGKQRVRGVAVAAAGALGVSVLVTGNVAGPSTPSAQAAPSRAEPALTVEARRDVVRVERHGRFVYPRLRVKALAGDTPFEVWAERSSYRHPIEATRVVRHGRGKHHQRLPDGAVTNWRGLEDFTRLVVRRPGGRKVVDRTLRFCPLSARRTESSAPRSPYPRWCGGMRWTLGMVWGVQSGWEAPLADSVRLRLPVGRYRVRVAVTKPYREALRIPRRKAAATVSLRVRPGGDAARTRSAELTGGDRTPVPRPADVEPTHAGTVPGKRFRPDLRALPAWNIGTRAGRVKDFLTFNANVWNAGPAPLVVDGFREDGETRMDAYQNFYDDHRDQVGVVRTGEMIWDERHGHGHWHFTDFARYRLLRADGERAVRSHKQSFCLVPTDAIDYTVKNADWRPGSGDLHTMCGHSASDRSLRQVMQVGSGDTYSQWRAGQAFDVTRLPNGTYYVEIRANPEGRLYEKDTRNNVTLRKVRLGGERGSRTVTVFPFKG